MSDSQPSTPYDKIIGLLQALVALQWLLSGIAKLRLPGLGSRFTIDLAETIHETRSTDEWYHNFVDVYLVPRGDLLGTGIAIFELAAGLILILGAVDWLSRHQIFRRWLHSGLSTAVVTALTIGIFLDYNIALVHGLAFPTLGLTDSFTKAIPYEFFLIFLSLLLIATDVLEMRAAKSDNQPTVPAPLEKPALVVESHNESITPSSESAVTRPSKIPENLLPRPIGSPPAAPPASSSGFPTTDSEPPPLTPTTPGSSPLPSSAAKQPAAPLPQATGATPPSPKQPAPPTGSTTPPAGG